MRCDDQVSSGGTNKSRRLSNVCRGGAELLFDGKKRHEVDLPGEECKYFRK